ncbi:MAG: putative metal-binding membrane protein [Paracoccaceae bacterium]|jgi:predicted metal-binding membrane protein
MTVRSFSLPWRSVSWLGFFATIIVAWMWLFVMARMSGVDVWGVPRGMNMMPMESFGTLWSMWAVMMAAMMLPTMVPTLSTYDQLIKSANGTRSGWVGVALGYLGIWVAFGALLGLAQLVLLQLGIVDMLGISASGYISAVVLVAVGAFQFSYVKETCHGVCHSPMSYFLGHWKPDFAGGLRMGGGLGAFCVGCCWGYMLLGFVGGTMSLLWMGLATLVMVLEKLPQIGSVIIKPLGVVLIVAGVLTAAMTAGFIG